MADDVRHVDQIRKVFIRRLEEGIFAIQAIELAGKTPEAIIDHAARLRDRRLIQDMAGELGVSLPSIVVLEAYMQRRAELLGEGRKT